MIETGWHWRTSAACNRVLCGTMHEPLCSRAWRRGWHLFIECMAVAFRDPVHCEDVHLRWLAAQVYDPPPVTGRHHPDPGY
ncbi:hypothetical protein ACFOM8_01855 [Paracoccus angustae]|uniref:Uncharacterized protein n=1 Tax=Paracoccus angustae TaxID=1671480 RepID=A0ABV7TZU7_9RHOB